MTTEYDDANRKDKKLMAEFLMLPCTAIGQTTSSTIAEKSNIWAEQRLVERKHELDQKLYKNMIKINVDMLDLTDELTRLRKSPSSSSLDGLLISKKQNKKGFASGPNSPKINARGHTAVNGNSVSRSNQDRMSVNKTGSGLTEKSTSGSKRREKMADEIGSESTEKSDNPKRSTKFSYSMESSSDESEHSDSNTIESGNNRGTPKKSVGHPSNRHQGNELRRTISVTSCTLGRECGANRAEFHSFQNATKRYNKQLSNRVHSANNIK